MPLSSTYLCLQARRSSRACRILKRYGWRSCLRCAPAAEVSPRQVRSGSMRILRRCGRWRCRWHASVAGVSPCRAVAPIGAVCTAAGFSSSCMGRLLCIRSFRSIPLGVTSSLTSYRSKYFCLRFRLRSVKIRYAMPLAIVSFCHNLVLKRMCSLSVCLPLELGLMQVGR